MEAPNLLENGSVPQQRKCPCCKVVLYTSIFVLIVISVLVSVIFCLLHHEQPPGTCWAHGYLINFSASSVKATMVWEWNFKHCDGLVQNNTQNHLTITKNGNYFVYAQVSRRKDTKASFTLVLYKEPNIRLNEAVGQKTGNEKGTVSFGRPFSLQKGDILYCEVNFGSDSIELGDLSYWGLYKI